MSGVLLVDDNADIRLMLRTGLAFADGVDVVGEAENGAAAVLLVEEIQPAVVILDWHMPVLDGLLALPLLKQVAPATRVLMYSSESAATAAADARAAGADAYLEKPAAVQAVIDTVLRLAGSAEPSLCLGVPSSRG